MRIKGYFFYFVSLLIVFPLLFSGCSFLGIPAPGKNKAANFNSQNNASNEGEYAADYYGILGKYTRKAKVYDKFNTVMYVGATYLSPSFEKAYNDKYSSYYFINKNNSGKMSGKLLSGSRKTINFLVSVYTPNPDYNDLASGHSIWMVYLKNNENESVMPVKIEASGKRKAFLKGFFPYVNHWSKEYRVEFPAFFNRKTGKSFINGNTRWFELIITGVNGAAILKWNIR